MSISLYVLVDYHYYYYASYVMLALCTILTSILLITPLYATAIILYLSCTAYTVITNVLGILYLSVLFAPLL